MIAALLRTLSWQTLRHHPWRTAAAVLAVMLGVALGFAVHVINASALSEFSRAVRNVQGQPDLELRAAHGTLTHATYAALATDARVALASPWLEIDTQARSNAPDAVPVPLKVVGADTLLLSSVAPALAPRVAAAVDRLAMVSPDTVFLNATALAALHLPEPASGHLPRIRLQAGSAIKEVTVAGTVSAAGAPVAVMDIGAAQDFFARQGELSRIDLQLRPGVSVSQMAQRLPAPAQSLVVAEPGDAALRVDNLSRAYRVNLTVLALVALFTGAFLVFSILALSVAQRAAQFALLGVLGVTPGQRQVLVLAEAGVLGAIGSVAGIALGAALAAAALRLLGGDLGGGYFTGVHPDLQFDFSTALIYALLGLAAALVGGWWPARQAQSLAPAQTLKGLSAAERRTQRPWTGLLLLAVGIALAQAPAWNGVPVAAYTSVGLLLIGGIALLPWVVQALIGIATPFTRHAAPLLLATERARRTRSVAAIAVGGVVASLSLAVALTVMVGSFRTSVTHWLDTVVPAPWYVRVAGLPAGDDAAIFTRAQVQAIRALPGVEQVQAQRVSSVRLDAQKAPIAVLARSMGADPASALPLVQGPIDVPARHIPIYVSEAVVALYGVQPGDAWPAFNAAMAQSTGASGTVPIVAGVWRDYLRQFGAVAMDSEDYARWSGDERATDLALWPRADADIPALQRAIAQIVPMHTDSDADSGVKAEPGQPGTLAFTSSGAIRARTLNMFDRTFAVTYWLQAVAIGIGLFGVAASFSAQVLARRKEFGLLAHLGLTRRQILGIVAGEGLAWTVVGAVVGTALGLGVSAVLVFVVNPQSFHWTMDLQIPWWRLLALALALIVCGTVTAWFAGRAAASPSAVLAVKEDW